MKTNGYRIFEKKASLRKRTRKGRNGNIALRILSAGLALSMLFTGCGPASVMPLTVPEGVEQVEAAAKAAEIVLEADEISELEALGDAANINTLREWEKEM